MERIARIAILYAALAFTAGFVFGVLRELVLVPVFGPRFGPLIEFPIISAVVVIIGIVMGRRFGSDMTIIALFVSGCLATLCLVAVESAFALLVIGQPLPVYLESYNVLQGALFPFGLALMALAPAFGRIVFATKT